MTNITAYTHHQPAPARTSPVTRPELTERLDYVLGRFTGPPEGVALPDPSPREREEARRVLPAFEARASTPITHDRLMSWLRLIVAAVRNPQTQADLEAFASAAMVAFRSTPGAAFGRETLEAVMKANQFFPSVADLESAIRPIADKIIAEAAALRRIAETRPSHTEASGGEPPEDWTEVAIDQRLTKLEDGPWGPIVRIAARTSAANIKRLRPDLFATFADRLAALERGRE